MKDYHYLTLVLQSDPVRRCLGTLLTHSFQPRLQKGLQQHIIRVKKIKTHFLDLQKMVGEK